MELGALGLQNSNFHARCADVLDDLGGGADYLPNTVGSGPDKGGQKFMELGTLGLEFIESC